MRQTTLSTQKMRTFMEAARHFALGAVLVCAGIIVGMGLSSGGARAEAQSPAQPQHFQSGAQLSVPVLREIAATLKQMDARLARIETAAQQFRPGRVVQPPGN